MSVVPLNFSIPLPAGCVTCCDPCKLGTTVNLLLAGIVVCVPCLTFPSGTDSVALSNISGLNAAHVLTGPDSGGWSIAGVGSIDYIHYDTPDCTGPPAASGTSNFNIGVGCVDGIFSVAVAFNYSHPGGTIQLFPFIAVNSPLDTATPNDNASCLSPAAGLGGTSTISVP